MKRFSKWNKLGNNSLKNNLSINSRETAQTFFAEDVVFKKYKEVYRNLLLK